MRPPGWALASSLGAFVALVGGWLAAGAVQPPGHYDAVGQTISVLAGHGAAHRWIMAAGLFVVGAAHLVTAAGLRGARVAARAALAVGGAAGLGLAAFAEPRHGTSAAHIACTTVSLLALAAFGLLLGDRRATRFPLRPRDAAAAGVLSVVLFGWLLQAMHGTTLGAAERVLTAQQAAWPVLAVLALRTSGGRRARMTG